MLRWTMDDPCSTLFYTHTRTDLERASILTTVRSTIKYTLILLHQPYLDVVIGEQASARPTKTETYLCERESLGVGRFDFRVETVHRDHTV